uniref:NADH-ubiquinone oxidoreductase chain 2 n=1 Tax=Paragnetina indentata TaxID=2810020 RepID=A0A890CII2_9NEOP|nr:NADH dehydrogenase subunit 2 [Paragnetina indentata]QRG31730.1 NADH dehydrogenase subunit 2 [Paragnetina indentata]
MINNPTKLLFIATLMGGTVISISSNSWFGAWVGLEINLLSFIPLLTNTSNLMTTEASLKYFLTQALASAVLLFTVIFSSLIFSFPNTLLTLNPFINSLINSSLLLKMGAAPFHFWFPGVMEGLTWMNGFILMTWQKIGPLMLLSYNLSLNIFTTLVIFMSVVVGSIGGLNQSSLRKILAYSSINHLGWLISALMLGENLWNIYFITYSFLTATIIFMLQSFGISHLNQAFTFNPTGPIVKFALFSSLLSLGGLPPFLGFLPKWIIIQNLTSSGMIFIVTVMVTMTLITLFYYLRLGFSAFMLSYPESLWSEASLKLNSPLYLSIIFGMISTMGLPISSLIMHLI